MKKISPKILYDRAISRGDLVSDDYQLEVVNTLNDLYLRIVKPKWIFNSNYKNCVYIQGDVGRGKTMLMNMFFASIRGKIKSRRVHFHAFMKQIHCDLHSARKKKSKNNDEILPKIARDLAKTIKVLCLDEFHVRDIADAMILSRLIRALMSAGITIIFTSNDEPKDLYRQGIQRELFLPFIDDVYEKMNVVSLKGHLDYRKDSPKCKSHYFYPRKNLHKAWNLFAQNAHTDNIVIKLSDKEINIKYHKKSAWIDFSTLCEQPWGASEYIELAKRYDTFFIINVPRMGYDRRNETLRFMILIDILYDNDLRVCVVAAASPDNLYFGREIDFSRTSSRLMELSYKGWGCDG